MRFAGRLALKLVLLLKSLLKTGRIATASRVLLAQLALKSLVWYEAMRKDR